MAVRIFISNKKDKLAATFFNQSNNFFVAHFLDVGATNFNNAISCLQATFNSWTTFNNLFDKMSFKRKKVSCHILQK